MSRKCHNADNITAALNYIGKDVTYPSTQIKYDGTSTSVPIKYNLPTAADRAKIYIFDDQGNQILLDNAPTAVGDRTYVWDGKDADGNTVPAGNYQFAIDALDSDDQSVTATSTAGSTVTGIETKNGDIYLDTATGETIKLGNILSVAEHVDTQA